jgi:enterochelin esterase-like enzyme
MRHRLPFVLTSLAIGHLAAQDEMAHFTQREGTYRSAAVDREMPYGIYLPKGYDDAANKDTRWPLVIWLHGMFEDHNRFHRRGGAPVLDEAVDEGLLPPCVFVLADGTKTSMYIDAGPKKDYQQLIQKDLLGHLEKTYRISGDREQRALMGISMGGMAALRIGFTHPELFGTIAVHSSAVFPADPKQLPPRVQELISRFRLDTVFGDPIDEKLWRATNPLGIAESLDPKKRDGLRIYFDAGTEDRFDFGKTNQMLHEVLEQKKVPHTWELVQGGGHAWGSGFKDKSLLNSLKFVGDSFRTASARNAALEGGALKGMGGTSDDGDERDDGEHRAGGNDESRPPR